MGTLDSAIVDIAAGIGLVLVVMLGLVIFGGVRRIAHVTAVLVPIMAVAYILLGIAVVALNIGDVSRVLADIVGGAFGFREVAGGAVGAAIVHGIRRGMFSNEAGLGSAPNAGADGDRGDAGVQFPDRQLLYGEADVEFLTTSRPVLLGYRMLVLLAVFGGALGSLTLVWNLADVFMGVMALVDLAAIIPLAAIAFRLLDDYQRQRRDGKDPVYVHNSDIADSSGIECWPDSPTRRSTLEPDRLL